MVEAFFGIIALMGAAIYAAKIKNVFLAVACCVGLGLFVFYCSQVRILEVLPNNVRVESKLGGYAVFSKDPQLSSQVYLLVGPVNKPWGARAYSVNLPVIPIGTVDELNHNFGDFRKCNSPGSGAALNSIVELRLLNANKTTLDSIEKSFKESSQAGLDVFIRVDGHLLTMIEDKLSRRKMSSEQLPPKSEILATNLDFFVKKSQ